MINYIELLEECNRNRKNIELPKSKYKTFYGENICGVFFKGNFYSEQEYNKILIQENNTIETRISEIDKLIEQEK